MHRDKYGQIIMSEDDICNAFMKKHDLCIKNALVDFTALFDDNLELTNVPVLIQNNTNYELEISEFDKQNQNFWYMPEEYKELDIAAWVLSQCKTDVEYERAGHELLLFLEKDLYPLLQYLKYLVDTMRKHNIVWGVGRGSSVSSYVLYLIGVHKINPITYNLDVTDFLK